MTTPEINSNINTQVQPDNGSGKKNVGEKRTASIKLFFDENLTRQQIGDEFGETGLNLFDSVNKDGDDTISQSEFDTYIQAQQEVQGKSGKRTAFGGV